MTLRSTAVISIAASWAAAVLGAPVPQSIPGSATTQLLIASKTVEREISGSARHEYRAPVEPGHAVTVVVEQTSIDLVIQLVAAGDVQVVQLDDEYRLGGSEELIVSAEQAASHTIVVRPARKRDPAGVYRISLAPAREATARDRILFEVQTLRTRAAAAYRTYNAADGVAPARRALEIAQANLDSSDPWLARLTLDLGHAYESALEYGSAQRHYERALTMLTAALGPDHPQVAVALGRLGTTYTWTGDLAAAERFLSDGLRRQEEIFGPEHPLVAMTLMSMAGLLEQRGDLAGAERLYQKVTPLLTQSFGVEDERFGILQNNLGRLYLTRRDFARAEPHLERAVDIQEKILGADHPRLAIPIQNLGMIAREKKDYALAERYYRRTLAIREKTVGLDHPIVAGTLNNLANLYGAQGDHARSLSVHLQALAIAEKQATPWTQPILFLGNIARTYAALGDYDNALAFQRRVDAAIDTDMSLNLAIGSERQKMAYLNNFIAERTERTVSFHLRLQPGNPEAARLAIGTLLQRKGRVLDVMTSTLAPLRARAAPDEQQLLDRLAETTSRFARLALDGPGKTAMADHLRELRALEDTREQLEAEISRRSDEARAALQRVSLESVQRALRHDAALIEFAVYRPFDPKAPSMTVAYGSPRYAVYVVRNESVAGIDLGEAAPIERAVESFRSAVHDPARPDAKRLGRAVDERIMQPVRALVAAGTRLLISPDGPLALIPLEALVDENGDYLLERYPVTYLSAGRDLLRMQVARASRDAPVVVADPFFGDRQPTPPAAAADLPNGGRSPGADAYFAPLAGTRYEAAGIHSIFPDARMLVGAQASEAALKAVRAPRILHIATHGFFTERSPAGKAPADNPLLRSGLALAGANLPAGPEDGILTAMEAAHLNLWGTKLVTLSACDTGVGAVRNGDGVYGLRRSIVLAGAETLVMSLWPVSDAVTREMMTAFYKGLKAGMGRGDALRHVQLSMIRRKGREHPFYWASFIQAGEWANLDGRR